MLLSPFRFTEFERQELAKFVIDFRKDWGDRHVQDLKGAKLALAAIDDRLSRLADAYIDKLIDKDLFQVRKEKLTLERAAALERIEDLEAGIDLAANRLSEFFELASALWLSYESAFPSQKREILHSISSNLTTDGKNVAVALKSPFREVVEGLKSLHGDPMGI